MDLILNELSLHGQFLSLDDFCASAKSLATILQEIRSCNTNLQNEIGDDLKLYKPTTFNQLQVTPQMKFYELLTSPNARLLPEIQRLKSLLTTLQTEPYWDTHSLQNSTFQYLVGSDDFRGTGIAEAYARSGVLISFIPSNYSYSPVVVECNEVEKRIVNIFAEKDLIDHLYKIQILNIGTYIRLMFNEKLNFNNIDYKYGFNLISSQNANEFISSFKGFEQKSWQEIIIDDGLDYKEFHKNKKTKKYFEDNYWKKGIYKFKISSKIRVFGYRELDTFYVLRFDLNHKLSDLG